MCVVNVERGAARWLMGVTDFRNVMRDRISLTPNNLDDKIKLWLTDKSIAAFFVAVHPGDRLSLCHDCKNQQNRNKTKSGWLPFISKL